MDNCSRELQIWFVIFSADRQVLESFDRRQARIGCSPQPLLQSLRPAKPAMQITWSGMARRRGWLRGHMGAHSTYLPPVALLLNSSRVFYFFLWILFYLSLLLPLLLPLVLLLHLGLSYVNLLLLHCYLLLLFTMAHGASCSMVFITVAWTCSSLRDCMAICCLTCPADKVRRETFYFFYICSSFTGMAWQCCRA